MTDRLAEIARAYASRLLNVALALAFLLIPVRCDAASAAHSIFLTPEQSGVAIAGAHAHSAASATHQHTSQGKAIPSKDMAAPHPAVADAPRCGDEGTGDTGETDSKSQNPVGATLYLPIPTALHTLALNPSLETEQLVELPLPGQLSSAELMSPEPPPPKPANR